MHDGAARRRIRLAEEPPFRLGALEAAPAARELRRGDAREVIEPRVMQVLCALAEARGEIVGRDTLIDRCWDGIVVGDNAINRVISRLRRLSDGIAQGCFRVETVTKVGYRLVAAEATADQGLTQVDEVAIPAMLPERGRAAPSRRAVLAGGLAAAGALGLGIVVATRGGHRRDPPADAAQRFYLRGLDAQQVGSLEGTLQAIAFFREATRREPRFADAWGALALAYRHLVEQGPDADTARVTAASRAAAARALALDPDNAEARIALALLTPVFRHWADVERRCRALLRTTDHWLLYGTIGRVLAEVGRCREAAAAYAMLIARDAFLPASRISYGLALWGSGRPADAERALTEALRLWPRHDGLWTTLFNLRALDGQPDAALAMLARAAERPLEQPPLPYDLAHMLIDALADGAPAKTMRAAGLLGDAIAARKVWSPIAAQYLASLGAPREAMRVARRYLLGRSGEGPPTRRLTGFLFLPSTMRLRRLPDFNGLTRELGLDDYWRATGTRPDYRRAGGE